MSGLRKSPSRLLILGSCVSRDILNFSNKDDIVLSDYYARSSIASLAAAPADVAPKNYEYVESAFQRRTVKRDVEKTFFAEGIQSLNCDAILIDLIDERFDLYEMAPGVLVTVSGELLQTQILTSSDRTSARWIRSGSERHRELWKSGLRRLFDALMQRNMISRVIVNKVFWADRMEDRSMLPGYDSAAIREANELLEWMYRELETYVPPAQWMKFDSLLLNPEHRWGIAPFHYSDTFYREAALQLAERIAFVRTGGDLVFEDGVPVARAQPLPGSSQRFAFFLYHDAVLLKAQGYSDKEFMSIDSLDTGKFDVVIFTLALQNEQPQQVPARTTRILRYWA
jgi:hypothetical protein